MSNDTKFINGLIVKAPHERAPEYVKAKLSIKREELIAWLQTEQGEWINADIKVSQGGKWYAAVGGAPQRNRPARATDSAPADDFSDEIPFATSRGNF